jgi:hypothetical protein
MRRALCERVGDDDDDAAALVADDETGILLAPESSIRRLVKKDGVFRAVGVWMGG